MATALPSTLDPLPHDRYPVTPDHVGLRLGVSARSVARGVLLVFVFVAGFAGGAIVSAEGERAVIELERTP